MRVQESRVSNANRAAIYVRMSTEHQAYSIANQTHALEQYARDNKMVIVKRFVDPGKSGLTLSGRPGLKDLLLHVISTEAEFEHILVYDVSRWGRFLDADESAYYEYTCKRANVKVHYCLEPFVNDGSVYSTLVKNLKRVMAGEYSRELSVKVHAGQARLAQLGFRQGGPPGYGIRRQLVDINGNVKGWLKTGDRKGFQSDRVMLTVGPQRETDVVRKIFEWFVMDGLGETQIARLLTERDIEPEYFKKWAHLRAWTCGRVHQVLTNPKYIGTIAYNRTSRKLHEKTVRNPDDKWVCRKGAFEAVVDPALYEKAQQIIRERLIGLDNYQVLDRLSALLKRVGRLSASIINDDPDTPSSQEIVGRFKSLPAVYELVGFKPWRDMDAITKRQRERGRNQGFDCLGDAILDAVASGRLESTFTVSALRAACPGWAQITYSATCAHYTRPGEVRPVKLQRVSLGIYQIVTSLPKLRNRIVVLGDCQILDRLALLLKKTGKLTHQIIAEDRSIPSLTALNRRFGGLRAVYELLGYHHKMDRVGIQKRTAERKAARGAVIMADAIRNAFNSGRLAETFTIKELKANCPGWADSSYHTLTRRYATRNGAAPIKLLRVGRCEYRIVH